MINVFKWLGSVLLGKIYTVEDDLTSRNAYNKPGMVVVDPDTPYRAAVWAQEAYEARLKLNPVKNYRIRNDINVRRDMELTSHEIEVQTAVMVYQVNEASYRHKEATSLQRGYRGAFQDWSIAEIEDEMRQRSKRAEEWVIDHWAEIREQK